MLQFISHENTKQDYLSGIEAVLKGGCKWIQLRMKNAPEAKIIEIATSVKKLTQQYQATFILDDYVHLVEIVGADGVHLGKMDMPIEEARQILGKNKIIGGTANSFEDVVSLVNKGVNYVGLGPFRFTTTKEKLSPILGIEGYKSIITQCKEHQIHIPMVAIGGITKEDILPLAKVGVTGIAVSGAILQAKNPIEETKQFINLLHQNI